MAYVILDRDAVFENSEYCMRVPYFLEGLPDGRARFVIIAGSLSWKGILEKDEIDQIREKIKSLDAKSILQTGRSKFIQFDSWASLERLASW